MRVIVTGATGNVGTSVLRSLAADERTDEIVGIARRVPVRLDLPKVSWRGADVTRDPLERAFEGADVVIHLAWAIQPSRDRNYTRTVNVEGTRRVLEAVSRADVPAVVYASSVGAYSPGPADGSPVDESWPTEGVETSFYSVDKAATERLLDEFEQANPDRRAVRLRPALIFKREAATEITRLFAGPLLPRRLVDPMRLPLLPWIAGLTVQVVHADDVADAYRRAALGDAEGAFNIAAEPVLDASTLGEALDVRTVPVPAAVARVGAAVTWRSRLQPTPSGWVDMGAAAPVMDTERARGELGWAAAHGAVETFTELMHGISRGSAGQTPPLSPAGSARSRLEDLLRGGPPVPPLG